MPSKNFEIDGFRVGPFTEEEGEKLRRAIDDHIGSVAPEQRNDVLRGLLGKRGREPSLMVLIGRHALPHRHPRSVYNYARRRIVKYDSGKWTPRELHVLLDHYFKHIAPLITSNPALEGTYDQTAKSNDNPDQSSNSLISSTLAVSDVEATVRPSRRRRQPGDAPAKPKVRLRHSWRPVSQRLNRLPEQVHDKWKELRPCVEKYRSIFDDLTLTEEQRINQISKMIETNDRPNVPKPAQLSTGMELIPVNYRGGSRRRPTFTDELRRDLHEFIRSNTKYDNTDGPLVSNIPWKKVSDHFKMFSESNLRLQWTLITFPYVLKRHVEGFSHYVVGRYGLHILRKNRIRVDRLGVVDFSYWLPQFPPLYVMKCVDGFLKRALHRYRKGNLRHVDVFVRKKGILTSEECANLAQYHNGLPVYVTTDGVYYEETAKHEPRPMTLSDARVAMLSKGIKQPNAQRRRPIHELVAVDKGYVKMTLYRQIKLAYFEFQVRGYISSDMKIISKVPQTYLPPF